MKTSDKILLCTTLSFVGVFIVIDLLHYVNYARGNVLDFAAIEQQDYVQHEEEGIHWLVLDGPMLTSFYPAETLKIDVDRSVESKFVFTRINDTLFVSMPHQWSRGAHDVYTSYGNYPSVNVFFPALRRELRGIKINKGFAIFDNTEGLKGLDAVLELDSTQCWLGRYDQERDTVVKTEPWDTIRVKGVNANFVTSNQAHVKVLDLVLDAKSEVADFNSSIDSASVAADSNTAIHFHGRNFKKLHFDAIVHPTP
jgi:hypothetical protein